VISFRKVFMVFRKEMVDVLRDRKTLIFMLLMPVVLIPGLMIGIFHFTTQVREAQKQQTVKAVLVNFDEQPRLKELSDRLHTIDLLEIVPIDEIDPGSDYKEDPNSPDPLADRVKAALENRSIQAAVEIPTSFSRCVFDDEAASYISSFVKILYISTIPMSKECSDRIEEKVKEYRDEVLDTRLKTKNYDRAFVEPFAVNAQDLASVEERGQAFFASFFPYLIILFAFMGGLYPAIDLGAGEKERFTLETLLLAPVGRAELSLGKFLVIMVTSIVASLLSLVAMAVTFTSGALPAEISALSFSVTSLVLSFTLFLPLAAIFASVLLAISIYAKSFKEAQNYATPIQIVLILPAIMSLIPEFEMTPANALIPILNISMLMREFLKENYMWDFYAVALVSTAALAVLSTVLTARMFSKESVIFRS